MSVSSLCNYSCVKPKIWRWGERSSFSLGCGAVVHFCKCSLFSPFTENSRVWLNTCRHVPQLVALVLLSVCFLIGEMQGIGEKKWTNPKTENRDNTLKLWPWQSHARSHCSRCNIWKSQSSASVTVATLAASFTFLILALNTCLLTPP